MTFENELSVCCERILMLKLKTALKLMMRTTIQNNCSSIKYIVNA